MEVARKLITQYCANDGIPLYRFGDVEKLDDLLKDQSLYVSDFKQNHKHLVLTLEHKFDPNSIIHIKVEVGLQKDPKEKGMSILTATFTVS